ncbi:hypothetical protein QO021_28755 (plasmid) [Pseudomonas amygdali pv. lachrymans]|uniref:DUF2968 domain-containing protein n=1 Tax=Pseudomonas amygdali TaxID=47877 RepID=UPI000AE646E6|nr:DUF2968 domain-containing protein [Pseudomonas amygdali]RMM39327.1 hypothetical protein ALQ79_200268 [Pseudomonas amygdali pv. lachrymans]WIO61550.1 hypothetical protein QO021_28755 [Pseudomonas amygdali pv. lachrymans]
MKYPNPTQLVALYESNEEIIQHLTQQAFISAEDIQGCNKNILTRLASDFWGKISSNARAEMLSHAHHFVRSCARIAQQDLEMALAKPIVELSENHLVILRQDLCRRSAEMEANPTFQKEALLQGSTQNADLASLNVQIHAVRCRLAAIGKPETPKTYIWI